MNKNPIYAVTTVRGSLGSNPRTVGFFHEFGLAEQTLKENIMDINEMGHYPYAVIERISPGIYNYPREEMWYRWNNATEGYERILEKPERFRKVVGWGIG